MKKLYISLAAIILGAVTGANAQNEIRGGSCLLINCPQQDTVFLSPSNEGCTAALNYAVPKVYNYCNGQTITNIYNFSGNVQTFVVPEGVTEVFAEIFGAEGGAGSTAGNPGGQGGQISAYIYVNPGDTLLLYVGGKGQNGGDAAPGTNVLGGWNGGGIGGFDPTQPTQKGGGGGGASDIRFASDITLSGRVMVAAGGGGGAGGSFTPAAGGDGGGGTGLAGGLTFTAQGGGGGTQNAGGTVDGTYGATNGSFGLGGNGATNVPGAGAWGSGGGGAGWYGGAGGTNTQLHSSGHAGAGGGGSSYADPNLTFGTITTTGGRIGNGQITLTYFQPEIITPTQTSGFPTGSNFPVGTTVNSFEHTLGPETVSCSFVVVVSPSSLFATAVSTVETEGNDANVTLTVTGGIAPYEFEWTGPGNFTSDSKNPTGLTAGTYNVTVTDDIGCTFSTSVIVSSVVGISQNNLSHAVSVFPNPSNGTFQINTSADGQAEIFAVNGQLIHSEKIFAGKHTIQLKDAEAGIYILRIISNEGVAVKKLIVNK